MSHELPSNLEIYTPHKYENHNIRFKSRFRLRFHSLWFIYEATWFVCEWVCRWMHIKFHKYHLHNLTFHLWTEVHSGVGVGEHFEFNHNCIATKRELTLTEKVPFTCVFECALHSFSVIIVRLNDGKSVWLKLFARKYQNIKFGFREICSAQFAKWVLPHHFIILITEHRLVNAWKTLSI